MRWTWKSCCYSAPNASCHHPQTAVAQTVSCIPLQCIPGEVFSDERVVEYRRDQDDLVFGKVHPLVDERGFFGGATQEPRLGRERAHYSMHACIHQVTPKCLRPTTKKKVPHYRTERRALDQPEPLVILERRDRRVRGTCARTRGRLVRDAEFERREFDLEACDDGCTSNLCAYGEFVTCDGATASTHYLRLQLERVAEERADGGGHDCAGLELTLRVPLFCTSLYQHGIHLK